ncbi:hypothetical protein [Sutcliffiella deserti]|uniref:hypothetical protein n=1 Tax=Sutcliffiella deserti TaxID=2875501 RepID=UPI001CBE2111|nr:hypothetical protein [Sutcliffiella deserti]
MEDSSNMQKKIAELSQTSTNMLLENILKKHNVKLSKEKLSSEQKAKLKKLVKDLQDSFQKLEKMNKK